jgi:probable HAF family extracellular repeat protein
LIPFAAVKDAPGRDNFINIFFPGSTGTLAYGINNSREIVGEYSENAGGSIVDHGFLLSGGIYSTIDFPGSHLTAATGINNSGQIVGFYQNADFVTHGFLLSGGIYSAFDFPGSILTLAYGINDSGEIVGQYRNTGNPPVNHGFLLSGGIYSTIDFPDSTSNIATGINNSGQIVGFYQNAADYNNGVGQGFLASPTPEPSTILSIIGGLGVIAAWRRRRRSNRIL